MSGVGREKPNLVFRLSPVKSYHDDRAQKLVKAKLDITGAILHSGGETCMQTYFDYDYIALGGRPVRKRKRRLKESKNRKKCIIKVEVTNYEISPEVPWDLIFTVSSRQGSRKRNSKRKYPFLQIFRTHEPVTTIVRDDEDNEIDRTSSKKKTYPVTRRTNNSKSLMKETSRRKKMKRLRHFYTKVHDTPDDPLRIFIPKQRFYHEPVTADAPEEEREKITYTLRLAGKRRHYDQTLFFHHANMFIITEDTRARLEARMEELEAEIETRGVRDDVSETAMTDRLDQLERIYELRIEELRLREEAEQSLLVDEERRIVREHEIRESD
ncbi:MAG: hypothetical protein GOP50_10720 [Candidatus Heimdallarchaeota archaeon]|nr:hypothetical protein [Candidatus Heimdallarchaeota archaeon]